MDDIDSFVLSNVEVTTSYRWGIRIDDLHLELEKDDFGVYFNLVPHEEHKSDCSFILSYSQIKDLIKVLKNMLYKLEVIDKYGE